MKKIIKLNCIVAILLVCLLAVQETNAHSCTTDFKEKYIMIDGINVLTLIPSNKNVSVVPLQFVVWADSFSEGLASVNIWGKKWIYRQDRKDCNRTNV